MKSKKSILLLQPRHIYAPPNFDEFGHIYMPISLIASASLIMKLGVDVRIVDENIGEANEESL